ncbi:hypothetical protein PG993_015181 [Apiospora rasikravindrae]|uniref:8-oxo-dGTP diphosphatase n=1 Tax=Apiospora rasikravindrae TaxID=990691 RepID=A0ABR1RQ56_9PEZI
MKSQIKSGMSHLDMSRDQFLANINKTASAQFDKLTIGAAVLNSDNRILLLRRRPDEKHYPNVYEITGGKVDETDPTIGQAIAREVLEESSLKVSAVLKPLSTITYNTFSAAGTRNVIQLSYVVQVEDTQFQVNPEEHSKGIWAAMDMLGELDITEDMKDLVMEALASVQ